MNIFNRYFEHRLAEMGWTDEPEVEFSLGNGVRVGISFTNNQSAEGICAFYQQEKAFVGRSLQGSQRVSALRDLRNYQDMLKLTATLSMSHVHLVREGGERIVHKSSVTTTSDFNGRQVVQIIQDDPAFLPASLSHLACWREEDWNAWHGEVCQFVKDCHDRTCDTLLVEANNIIQSSPSEVEEVWLFCTPSFDIRVWNEPFDYADLTRDDGDAFMADLSHLANGGVKVFQLRANIIQRKNLKVIAEREMDTCVLNALDADNLRRELTSHRRQLIHDLLAEARETLGYVPKISDAA